MPRPALVLTTLLLALSIASLPASEEPSPAKAAPRLKLGALPVGKMLFLGNSITLHGPAENIGWTGNWGMAASAREKDYVHLLLGRLEKEVGGKPEAMIRNIADFERKLSDYNIAENLKQELAFEADVVFVAIGENAASPKTDEDRKRFSAALDTLLGHLKEHGHPTLFVRSQFWPDEDKDPLLKEACLKAGGTFVDIGPLGKVEANYARSERKIDHEGVAAHPGDQGMSAIADKLWKSMKKRGDEHK